MDDLSSKSILTKQHISAFGLSLFIAVLILGASFSLSMLDPAISANHAAVHGYLQGSIMFMMIHATMSKPTPKAQSAMEYLMTYGWAILIISIVLGSLFSLGVFNGGGSNMPSACVPSSAYYCSISSYIHGASPNVVAVICQSTGTSWAEWGYYFCSACSTGANGPSGVTYNVVSSTGLSPLNSGGQTTVVLPTGQSSAAIGTGVSGTIWICWAPATAGTLSSASAPCTATSGIVNFVRIATLTAKAT